MVLPGHFGDASLTFDQAVVTCRQEPGSRPSLASIENEIDQGKNKSFTGTWCNVESGFGNQFKSTWDFMYWDFNLRLSINDVIQWGGGSSRLP